MAVPHSYYEWLIIRIIGRNKLIVLPVGRLDSRYIGSERSKSALFVPFLDAPTFLQEKMEPGILISPTAWLVLVQLHSCDPRNGYLSAVNHTLIDCTDCCLHRRSPGIGDSKQSERPENMPLPIIPMRLLYHVDQVMLPLCVVYL